MNQDNVERLRRGYDAFGRGDLDSLRELFAPDIVWHAGGDNALTGEYKGVDDVFAFFGKLFEMTEGSLQQEVHDVLANDEHAVALTKVSARRPDGRSMQMNQIGVYHVSGGKVTEAWVLPEDSRAADEFLS